MPWACDLISGVPEPASDPTRSPAPTWPASDTVERNWSGCDLRKLFRVGVEDRDGQGGNPDSGPLRSQGILESLRLPLAAAGWILVDDLKISGDLGICREVRCRDQIERATALPALYLEREGDRVANAQRGGAGGGRHAVVADSAAECRGPRNRDFAHLHRRRGATATSRRPV